MNFRHVKRAALWIAPVILAVLIVRTFTPNQTTLTYESLGISAAQALQGARAQAVTYGLIGEPTREEGALMTYGSYLALTDSPLDTRFPLDHPVYVYQVFGEIPAYQYVSSNGRTDVAGMIFAFDAIAGTWFNHSLILDGLEHTAFDLNFIPEAASRGNVTAIPPTLIPAP
ncbi:MAG: hypothetical protein MUF87_20660 [Anaerolineae bacterium]|jgi:hypothetical protein|nr:hypothetical protein [Anaerolineae bacterium]